MKAITAIGIVAALGFMFAATTFEGTPPMAFFNIPALLTVFGGTLGVCMASSSMEVVKKIPVLYKTAFSPPQLDFRAQVDKMVEFAERARREGLLALEDEIDEIEDEYTRKGLQLVVDGTDPDLVREILENEIDGMATRHHHGADLFEKGAGFAPTLGILGTVCSLVHVLQNLSNPDTLGPAISGAFCATLYGVGCANVVYYPIANKLKFISAQEIELRTMTLEGILAIQAGDNPRVVEDKLIAFLTPEEREAEAEGGDKPKLAEAA